MSPQDGPGRPTDEHARTTSMRWSMGLLLAAGISVMIGFLATQILTGRSAERLGGPSADAIARERVPSSGELRIDQPGTYDLFYEQAAPSTGVPGSLEVTIRSDQGDLGLGTPDPVLSAVIEDRSYVVFRTVRIPRAGTYTLDVAVRGGEPAQALLEDDRLVLDRSNREADALWMLVGLTPAAVGLLLAAGLGAASVWVRARGLRSGGSGERHPAGAQTGPDRWGPPTDQPFRDAPPPPEFPVPGTPPASEDPDQRDWPRDDGGRT